MPYPASNPITEEERNSITRSDLKGETLKSNDALPYGREADDGNDKEELSRPVVVPTADQMRNYKLIPRDGEQVNDTSYLGSDTPYLEKGDIPKHSSHIYEVTSTLEEVGIPNCVVGVWALNFYGAKRVGDDIHLTVPADLLPQASSSLVSKAIYTQVPHTGLLFSSNSSLPTYPRLKRQGVRLFIVLLPTSYTRVSLPLSPITMSSATTSYNNYLIRQEDTNIPFPTISNLIQSYLDTCNEVDLADIVDGLNIPLSWGGENGLDFSEVNDGNKTSGSQHHDKRMVWREAIQGRKQRMGYKYPEEQYVTRFMSRKKWDMILDGQIEMPGYCPRR